MIGRPDHEERREARIERLRERATKRVAEGERRLAGARAIADAIPFGQPILVGHHSERHARRDAERIRTGYEKGFEAMEEAKDLARRASAAEDNRAISSDDPEAISKLRDKLAAMKAGRDAKKAVNAAFKRGGWDAVRALAPTLNVADLIRTMSLCHHDRPYPPYVFTNLGGNIRRVEARIAELERQDAAPPREPITFADGTVIEVEDNRVCIRFPEIPPEELRTSLKRGGFHWSRSVGAWTRLLNETAWAWAKHLLADKELAP